MSFSGLSFRIALFVIGFLIFFLFRLVYGYAVFPNGAPLGNIQDQMLRYNAVSMNFDLSRRNYAGQKQGGGGAVGVAPQSVDQRYEKIAVLSAATETFDEDQARVRAVAEAAGALIQLEQALGLPGNRTLQIALGVPPEEFDPVIEELTQIGKQQGFQVNKVDKTNEYQSLLARQSSLAKSRDSLVALQSRDAELDALIALERSILDLENQIQDLGVAVGEFDSEFEFVTVKLTMTEVAPAPLRQISFFQRSKTALEWAIGWYLTLNLALLAFLGVAWLGNVVLRRFRPA